MILLSVAHSKSSTGAKNKKFGLSEYPLSQVMTQSCADFLNGNLLETQILDVDLMGNAKKYIPAKLNYIDKIKPELALEIHLDGGSRTANHHSCFYYGENEKTKRVSNLILYQLKNEFQHHGWGHVNPVGLPSNGYGNYGLIMDSKYPVIIVEPLFISNNVHAEWLNSNQNLELIGKLVAKGILEWKKEAQNSLLH